MLIARLIADPERLETRLDGVLAALNAQAMPVAMARMLENAGTVLHLTLPDGDRIAFKTILEKELSPSALLIADHEIEIPKLFVSDMDSTMIGQECIDELADFAGIKDHVSQITERAMRGEIDFRTALKDRVALLKGLDEGTVTRCLEERIRPMSGAKQLVKTLKSMGCRTVLVTGGFHHFADVVAEQLGFERVVGNRLEVEGGKLTGGLVGSISDSATKLAVLKEEREMVPGSRVLATGDGANDIPMLEAADYGIAFMAKPIARDAASGWVDSKDLTAVLDLLDIPLSERLA